VPLPADQTDLRLVVEARREAPKRDRLGHAIGDADDEITQGGALRSAKRGSVVRSGEEHLVGDAEDREARFRQLDRALGGERASHERLLLSAAAR
jgi:hypothetical protein